MTTFAMTRRSRRLGHATSLSAAILLALLTPKTSAAQLIAVRTIPIADADQFSFFPSLTGGMGSVSIAIVDSVHDPFVNPAAAARLRHPFFFSALTTFSVSNDAGRGRTYPLGALARTGSSFGGVAIAIQSITEGRPLGSRIFPQFFDGQADGGAGSRSNRYGLLMLGRTFAASRLSLGASARWSDLKTIDGTSLLYSDSRGVTQGGRTADVRFGMLKEWQGGQSLEALLFNHRVRMSHDVTYGDLYWDPVARQTVIRERLEYEQDHANTWGMHLEYVRPIGDSGWRAGVIVTANRIINPSRPAYEFETVPGNRGRSTAFNVGAGLARSLGATTFAADAIYEPIWSRIWGVSSTSRPANGAQISPGSKTIDSKLRFSNAIMRAGVSQSLTGPRDSKLQLQLGAQARSIYYTLDQRDLVVAAQRAGDRSWMEWTRSWGATVQRGIVQLNYRGRKMTGATRPGDNTQIREPPVPGVLTTSFAPSVALPATTLRDVSVMTHQLSLSLRIR